jgi:hypothetical protein
VEKKNTLITSLIVLDVLILSLITFLFLKNITLNTTEAKDVVEEVLDIPEIAGVGSKKHFDGIDICYESFCKVISAKEIDAWFDQGKLDKRDMYVYLADKIYPVFEKQLGGKITVGNKNGNFVTWLDDEYLDLKDIHLKLEEVLADMENGLLSATIRLEKKDLPGTDGGYADRYIEVDDSKQRLYAWIDGKVVREIQLSGPKLGYQVFGVFPIVDKGIAPIAPGGKYMPYWMAFYYSPWQESWYGLHALVWWYDDAGQPIYESLGNIGLRKSAGCIRMLLEDSKFLYENFERGDHVLIHE